MKHLSLLALVCLLSLVGCKKDTPLRTIQLQVTVPAYTVSNLTVNDPEAQITSIGLNSMNLPLTQDETLTPKKGDKLTIVYGFATDGSQYGQGTATFTYNGQTLLKINGGNGTQTIIVP